MSPSPDKENDPHLRLKPNRVQRLALGTFVCTWLILGFLLSYLHWTNAFYAAVLLTPVLTCLILRGRELRHRGLRFLPVRKALHLYGWAAITSISLLALFYTFELWRGKWAYKALVKTVESEGFSLDVKSLEPPPVDNDENLCELPLLSCLIQGNHNATLSLRNYREITPSEELERIQSARLPDRNLRMEPRWIQNQPMDLGLWLRGFNRSKTSASRPETREQMGHAILDHLSSFDDILTELHEAAEQRPLGRWNLPYEQGWFMEALVMHRDETLKNLISILTLRSVSSLAVNEPKSAAADIVLGLRLIDTVRPEPSIHIQLRRIAWLFQLFQPLWEGLASHQWNQEQLELFQAELLKIDLNAESRRLHKSTALLNMDLWNHVDHAYSIRSLVSNYRTLLKNNDGADFWIGVLWMFHPKGWSYQSKILTYRWFYPEADSKRPTQTPDPLCAIFVLPKFHAINLEFERGLPQSQTTIHQAILACALEQSFLDKNTFPHSLNDLVPTYLASLPETSEGDGSAIAYYPLPNQSFLLAPSFISNPAPEFATENNPHLSRFHGLVWDRVWRFPITASASK